MRAAQDPKKTTLWNFETHRAANQLRAVCQLLAMIALVGYSLTFLSREYDIACMEIVAPEYQE
ncbi:hypothetical protein PINS_up013872 [Pythium insidiosum]|nr:hypothetical protein PINS_up013872 [Pythium insidiosum]